MTSVRPRWERAENWGLRTLTRDAIIAPRSEVIRAI